MNIISFLKTMSDALDKKQDVSNHLKKLKKMDYNSTLNTTNPGTIRRVINSLKKKLLIPQQTSFLNIQLLDQLDKMSSVLSFSKTDKQVNSKIPLKKEEAMEEEDQQGEEDQEEDEDMDEEVREQEKFEVKDNQRDCIHLESLNNLSRHLNRSKKSISILDLNGNFLLFDKLAKDQFEHIYRSLEKESFFQRMTSQSNQIVASQYGKDLCLSLATNKKKKVVLKYTIFSEKSRKKFNKELDSMSLRLSDIKQIKNLINFQSYSDFYFAYLQCLTSNMFLLELKITMESITDFISKDQFDVNKKFLEAFQQRKDTQSSFQAIMLITRLSKKRQILNMEGLICDPLYAKFQMKTKRKIEKILNKSGKLNVVGDEVDEEVEEDEDIDEDDEDEDDEDYIGEDD